MKPALLNIEIRLKNSPTNGSLNKDEFIAMIMQLMPMVVQNEKAIIPPVQAAEKFKENVERILFVCSDRPNGEEFECTAECMKTANYFLYTTKNFGVMTEEIGNGNEDSSIGSYQWELPTKEFENLWESLLYGTNECPKLELLNFFQTSMEFARHGVDNTIVPQNRLILLNGPPGTGKTTLCKAVAQKLAIRMQSHYKRVLLVEVNSHSLFSKWFSESGKLIQQLFGRIEELSERSDWLIFVLIDEVESLTMGREASFAGTDPTDSIRAVNAVLTQLDKIKMHPNVFLLCTSNIEKALDSAFVDRVGLIRYIGHPSEQAIVQILANCVEEMTRVGLLSGGVESIDENIQRRFQDIAILCVRAKLSGRALRRLPITAYSAARLLVRSVPIDLATFLQCLQREVEREQTKKNQGQETTKQNGDGYEEDDVGINLDILAENLPQI